MVTSAGRCGTKMAKSSQYRPHRAYCMKAFSSRAGFVTSEAHSTVGRDRNSSESRGGSHTPTRCRTISRAETTRLPSSETGTCPASNAGRHCDLAPCVGASPGPTSRRPPSAEHRIGEAARGCRCHSAASFGRPPSAARRRFLRNRHSTKSSCMRRARPTLSRSMKPPASPSRRSWRRYRRSISVRNPASQSRCGCSRRARSNAASLSGPTPSSSA
mmetsp:Transcript_28168/g.87290  ORF Transcript_28168/g.87290 Transcript_28168/m.87290 type:complete len:216 (+) Transcript_28168:1004-1651(+)